MGIGYAAITKNLEILSTATATVNQDNFVVKFTGSPTTSGDGKTTATITNDLSATISVSDLTTTGQKAIATYTITNASEELSAALVANVTENTKSDYFKVTPTFGVSTIAKETETTLTIEVELQKTPVEDVTSDITVQIIATAAEV